MPTGYRTDHLRRAENALYKYALDRMEIAFEHITAPSGSPEWLTDYLVNEVCHADPYQLRMIPHDEVGHFVDVGANVGVTSMFAALMFPKAVLHAVEPGPPHHHIIQNVNTVLPGAEALRMLTVAPYAFGEPDTHVAMMPASEHTRAVAVPVLDGIPTINLLTQGIWWETTVFKIDCEGAEALLWSCSKYGDALTVALTKAVAVCMEVHAGARYGVSTDLTFDVVWRWYVNNFSRTHTFSISPLKGPVDSKDGVYATANVVMHRRRSI